MSSTTHSNIYAWNGVNWDKTKQTASGHLKVNVENPLSINTSGLATDTLQTSGNASLSSIDSKVATSVKQDTQIAQQLNKDGFSQVLLNAVGGDLVKADSNCVVQPDPENRKGWNCVNQGASTKFNLYFFGGLNEIVTLGEVESIYWKGFVNVKTEGASMPFMTIYTKPTGVGDAGAFYHSSITYQYANDDTIGIGEECVYYGKALPSTLFNNRKVAFNNVTVVGDGLDAEEVLYMSLHSDSGASVFAMNNTINLLGFNTASMKRNMVLETEPITQPTDPVDTRVTTTLWNAQSIPDTTDATTASVDLLGYKFFQVIGSTDNTTDSPAKVEWSADNVTFYRSSEDYISADFDTGDFSYCKSNACARYVRFYKANGSGSAETISLLLIRRKN